MRKHILRRAAVAYANGENDIVPGPTIDLQVYPNEAALLEGLRAGEPDACTCMVKRFAPLIYTKALRMLGDADEAENILQQTFIKACDKFTSFEERSGLGTWLYRIATNEALMQLRRREYTDTIETLDEAIQPADLPQNLQAWPIDPAGAVLNDELRSQLEQALAALPESLRIVFRLRELDGLSTEEAAAALGLGESAVKVRLHRARLRLRELLADYMAGEGTNV
ncbi:MAG TPA: sigma-70 family RNA polymerase sigma factor [Kouleothrix sp.]|nr:sigma-70 family RNA polymerase sigma factor [Kouleothrix sp.]